MANYNLTQTGAQVQALLNTVAAGYIYMGVADLTTTPDTTNPNVCYLLNAVGTYTNFGNIQHTSGIGIALWNGTAWSYQNVPSSAVVLIDATLTANSTNPVQSGGVYDIVNGQNQNYTKNYFITTTGEPVYNGLYGYTDYIPVSNGDVVEWKWGNTAANTICMGVYNSSKTKIDYFGANDSSGVRTITMTMTATAYIRCSLILQDIDNCYVKVNGAIVWSPKSIVQGLNYRISENTKHIDILFQGGIKELSQNDGLVYGAYIAYGDGKWRTGASYACVFYTLHKGDIIYMKANSSNHARYALIGHCFPYTNANVIYEDGKTTYSILESGNETSLIAPCNCFLYVYIHDSANVNFFPEKIILTRKPTKEAFVDYAEYKDTILIPTTEDTYNAYYRSGENDNFSFSDSAYKRLTYFPNNIVKGGEEISFVSTGTNAIDVYEFPYIPLNSSAINVFQNNAYITRTSFPATAATYKLTLNEKTRRIAFVLGATQNTTLYVNNITAHITSVTLPVVNEDSAIPRLSIPDFLDKKNLYYSGKRIEVAEIPNQVCGMVARSSVDWGAIGTSCNYGKYSVGIAKGEGTMYIYNLETYSKLATWTGTSKDTSIWHANCATFVAQKYDNSDYFPLLYVSVREGADPTNHPNQPSINVYRIVPTWSNGEISSFTATQIQTIWLPALTDSNGQGFPNVVYDKNRNCLWAIGRQNNQNAPYYQQARLFKYAIPTSLDSEISISSIEENWLLDATALYMQGAVVVGDYLFISKGYQSVGVIELYAINLLTHEVTNVIDLLSQGVTWEPEGTLYYNGHIWLQDEAGKLYEFFL